MKEFFKKNSITIVISLALFLVPFFWFGYGKIDLGGDSSRLYFFDPLSWLVNMTPYFSSVAGGLTGMTANFCLMPFLSLLIVIKFFLFNNSYLLNCLFSGLLLSGGFLFTYLSIRELINFSDSENSTRSFFPAVVGGLFYILSPMIIYGWQRALYAINGYMVYPLLFYFFLLFLHHRKYKYIIWAVIVTFILSLNFSFATAPNFFAFFPFVFIFLLLYALILKNTALFLKGFLIFISLFLLIQAFQLTPQLNGILNNSGAEHDVIFSVQGKVDRGLDYFLSVQPYVKLIYNFTNQPQYTIYHDFNSPLRFSIYDFGIKYHYIFFIYILIIAGGLFVGRKTKNKNQQKIFLALSAIFCGLVFLITANIDKPLLELYKNLFFIPGFSMFRSFYDKFSQVFVFFYALILGLSLFFLSEFFEKLKIKNLLFLLLIALIIFNGWPLISGQIVNITIWLSNNVPGTIKMDDNYLSFLNSLKRQKIDTRYLSFPLTNQAYQILEGKNGGAYFGPSSIAILGGKDNINGLGGFGSLGPAITDALSNKDLSLFKNYLYFLNARYIIHDSNPYIYNNFSFPGYPYPDALKSVFSTQDSITDSIVKLGYEKVSGIASFNLYRTPSTSPILYVPNSILAASLPVDKMVGIVAQQNNADKPAFYSAESEEVLALRDTYLLNLYSYPLFNQGQEVITKNNTVVEYASSSASATLASSRPVGVYSRNNSFHLINPISVNQVYSIGDSLTSAGIYETQLGTLLGNSWHDNNFGIFGQTTSQMQKRFHADVIVPGNAKYVIIWGGTNDLALGVATATIESNLQSIYTAARNAGIKVVAVNITPRNATGSTQTNLLAVNTWIANAAADIDYKIDAYTLLANSKKPNELNDQYDSSDHLHLSALGYDTVGAAIYNEVFKNGENLEFKKIDPTKYRIIIHHAQGEFPLVLSESFDDGWKMYLTPLNESGATKSEILSQVQNGNGYKILDENKEDQATADELADYISKGWVTNLGHGKNIDFISKNFQGTIQNDNLESGNFYETWFQKPLDDNSGHRLVNGYANSWDINPGEICSHSAKCVKNADGSYDMEFVIEYWPQRLFYIGAIISGTTLLGCLGFLGLTLFRRKKKLAVADTIEGEHV